MKDILIACNHNRIDVTLYQCMACLKKKSCRVSIAYDCDDMFSKIDRQIFDIVIVDAQIWDGVPQNLVDGLLHIDPHVPIILLMPKNSEHSKSVFPGSNTHCISRPVELSHLLELIDRVLCTPSSSQTSLVDLLENTLNAWLFESKTAYIIFVKETSQTIISTDGFGDIVVKELSDEERQPSISRLPLSDQAGWNNVIM